jgi:hypothetical protein
MNKDNKGQLVIQLLVAIIAFGVAPLYGQQSTEQYIPIGQSPGISSKHSVIGKIVAMDSNARTISINDGSGVRTVRITDETRYWFDRSAGKHENTAASYEDCEIGLTVEAMHLQDDDNTATWIKIESM